MFQNSINKYVNDNLREKLSTLCGGGSGFSYNIKPYIDLANGFTLVLKIIVQKDSSKESCIYLNVKNLENIKDARWCTNIKSKCFLWPLADNLIPIINNEIDCDILAYLITKVLDMDGSLPVDTDKIMDILNMPAPETGNYKDIYFSHMNLDSNDIGYKKIWYSEYCPNPRFIIMHQIVHWCLHRYAFQLIALNGNELSDTICNIKEYVEYDKTVYTCFWNIGKEKNIGFDAVLAYQADSIARKILVPYKDIYEIVDSAELMLKYRNLQWLSGFIFELANIFNVSELLIKSRLVDLGYRKAVQGFFNIVDGKWLKPYFFNRILDWEHETAVINERDYKILLEDDKKLKDKVEHKEIVYVDGHLVINNNKYVNQGCLTKYAQYNLDECCIVLETEKQPFYGKASLICGDNGIIAIKHINWGILNKDNIDIERNNSKIIKTIAMLVKHIDDSNGITTARDYKKYYSYVKEGRISEVKSILRNFKEFIDYDKLEKSTVIKMSDINFGKPFCEVLDMLMKANGIVKPYALSKKSNVDAKTISELLRNTEKKVDVKTIVKLCVALNVTGEYVNNFFDSAEKNMKASCPKYAVETIKEILSDEIFESVDSLDSILKAYGILELNKEYNKIEAMNKALKM